jgi:hypothetical protein
MTQTPHGDVIIGEHYYILASEAAAGLPKLVLKHDEAFLVANRRGDLPAQPDSEFGFYVDGCPSSKRRPTRSGAHPRSRATMLSLGGGRARFPQTGGLARSPDSRGERERAGRVGPVMRLRW